MTSDPSLEPLEGETRPVRKWPRLLCHTIVFALTSLIVGGVFLISSTLPQIAREVSAPRQDGYNLTVLDARGGELAVRGGRYAPIVSLDELPDYLIKAVLATEDRRFYEHGGFDFRGIARATFVNLGAGRFVQGGSTITQQLAKNLYLDADRTLLRKWREALITLWLEARLTKDEILTLYLNRIYMGAGAYGVEAAAQYYYGKSARNVTLAEAALLAGLPKAPSRFAPTRNLSLAHERAEQVLRFLVDNGDLSEGDVFAARAKPAMTISRDANDGAQHFVDWVTQQVPVLLAGVPEQPVRVRTTLSPRYQKQAERAIRTALERDGVRLKTGQGALVALDRDGAVLAMVGGRDYQESQFNRAANARRQPGSEFKPFVYLAALQSGRNPQSIVHDTPISLGDWTPDNVNNQYLGSVTMTDALKRSINTVAAKLGNEVGTGKIINLARQLGVKSPLAPNRSLPLGTSELTLLELSAAYATFGNKGKYAAPYGISEITDLSGKVLYKAKVEPAQVISKAEARDMTFMLYQVIHSGTGAGASLRSRPAAGKTGTSQDFRDAWFVGYTRQQTVGVWFGNDDDSPMARVTGGGLAASAWADYMRSSHKGKKLAAIPGAYPDPEVRERKSVTSFFARLSELFRSVRPIREASNDTGFRRSGKTLRR